MSTFITPDLNGMTDSKPLEPRKREKVDIRIKRHSSYMGRTMEGRLY